MIKIAFKNLFRKKLKSFLIIFLIVVSLLMNMLVGGIVASINKRFALIVPESITGKFYATSYAPAKAGLTWLTVSVPSTINPGIFPELSNFIYSPRIRVGGIFLNEKDQTYNFLLIFGVKPAMEQKVTRGITLVQGNYISTDKPEVMLPIKLAKDNNLKIGDKIIIFLRNKLKYVLPYEFVVSGFYTTALNKAMNYEMKMALVSYNFLQNYIGFGRQEFTDIAFYGGDINKVRKIARKYNLTVLPYNKALGFIQSSIKFLSILNNFIQLILFIILTVVLFNVIFMIILERKKEFGTLLAIGARNGFVTGLLILENIILTCTAFIISSVLYLSLCTFTTYNKLYFPLIGNIFTDGRLSISININTMLLSFIISLVVVVLASFYPAYKASKLNIIDILRVE